MNKVTSASTNPYLKDPVQRAKMVELTARTSTAIEGVNVLKFDKNSTKQKTKKNSTYDKS